MTLNESNVFLEGTSKTPEVLLSQENGYIKFQGRSIPENTYDFYNNINSWVDRYCDSPQKVTTIEIRLEYFNTSSSKCLLDIFKKLENLQRKGSKVIVKWCFEKEDEDMQEAGEDYNAIIGIPFDIIEVNEL